ncbi:hypothetical protein [Rhizobium sp. PP-CC-3G-465]|uniref:hypothetical protein n=1 Tax=Rhizobium sp. PP-CC-3G-465 TaxID=2135648 RepID=UPI0010487BD6|nr:hypothetical protein C8J33_11447 [Rhizobium sp. PP-CC-3G-465]
MAKLNCKVPAGVNDAVRIAKIRRDDNKGRVLEHFVDLALSSSTHVVRNFAGPDQFNCTLTLSEKKYAEAKEYRIKHSLDNKGAFFYDALLRGASVYLDKHHPLEADVGTQLPVESPPSAE